jgi:hypothetical protein
VAVRTEWESETAARPWKFDLATSCAEVDVKLLERLERESPAGAQSVANLSSAASFKGPSVAKTQALLARNPKPRQTGIVCFACGEPGHLSTQCPQYTRQNLVIASSEGAQVRS